MSERKQVPLLTLFEKVDNKQPITWLTGYDYPTAYFQEQAGLDMILVGDSLGMTMLGYDSTLPVTMDDMVYHTRCVANGNKGALLMADLPFMSYASEPQTHENAAALMQVGAQVVKLEGGAWLADSTSLLSERGIPVCAHMGLTPQSVNRLGGYLVQGRNPSQAEKMVEEAKILEDAGASILLLECVPVVLAAEITAALEIPVIGIGAGPDTDGQIMVVHDLLGITPEGIKLPRFVKNFLPESTDGIQGAFTAYVDAVKSGTFPAPEHCFI